MLTLTGAGGSGKTRLALEVVERETAATDIEGTWVELAPLSDPARLGDTVLAAMGVRDESDAPAVDRISAAIGERPYLLVLDNAEHLVDATAALVHGLLRAQPRMRVLVTSRAPLGVTGETAWLVPPMSLGAGTDAEESEAVQLFVQRGRAVVPAFRLTTTNRDAVRQICARLDGLPLALELAAARLRALSPMQIANRLDDRFRLLTTGNRAALPRQQTLRAAIDWSYDLLAVPERRLFQRLSVFRGSFTLEAAESVTAGGDVAGDDVLDLLAALIDQSLVEVVETPLGTRYRLLETMREYGEQCLTTAGDVAHRMHAHASYFVDLVRELEPRLRTPERPAAMDKLVAEIENLRHAVRWTREGDVQLHLRLVGLLYWFWFGTGLWPEATGWLHGALSLPEAAGETRDRAALLFSAGAIAALQARGEEARRFLEEAEVIAEREGDRQLLANVRNYLGIALNHVGDPGAEAVILRARPWLREANDLYGLRLNFLLQGQSLASRGELSEAVRVTEEGVRVARVFGQARELGIALQQLANVVAATGDWPRARSLLREALDAMRRDPMLLFTARAIELLAASAAHEGACEDAARLYGAARGIRDAIGAEMWGIDRQQHEPIVARVREALGSAAHDRIFGIGRTLTAVQAHDLSMEVGERLGGPTEPEPTLQTGEYRASVVERPLTPVHALDVRALGALEVRVEGVPMARRDWAYSKARELLVALLVRRDGLSREQVGVWLWPDASPTQLRNNFHVALHHLRRSIGHPEWVRFDSDRYRLDVPGTVTFDAATFEQSAEAALRDARRGKGDVDALRTVVERYHGEFLEGESVGDWQLEIRDRLSRLFADAAERLGSALHDGQHPAEAIVVLERLVAREPLRESAWRALMSARTTLGDSAGAIADYRRLEATLRREGMGAPSRETANLAQRIRDGRRT
ncbi:MAG: hypothetical protein IT361_02745 [Gemmatimonadaceae bacterium]|nr:hypothetical protein [Gemmatimonadaceae bacterium]